MAEEKRCEEGRTQFLGDSLQRRSYKERGIFRLVIKKKGAPEKREFDRSEGGDYLGGTWAKKKNRRKKAQVGLRAVNWGQSLS